jgi:hypothetical protein
MPLAYDGLGLRVQEISSDEDRLGVISQKRRSVVSDELYFNDGGSRYPRNYSDEHLAYGERPESEEEETEEEEEEAGALVVLSRTPSEEQAIARRALERIERAKAKGKPAVNLTHEEIEALEKRYTRDSPERERKRTSPKGKRSPSTSNGAWTRKKSSRRSSLLSSSIASPKQRSSKSGKSKDSPPEERYAPSPQPPGFVVQGPGGAPMYAPIGYYTGQPPPVRRTVSGEKRYSPPESRDSSRSTSASSRHTQQALAPYPYYDNARPTSRTVSLHAEPTDYAQYQTHGPALGSTGRRVASGPPEVSYSTVYRRVPVPSSSSRDRMQPTSSDPNIHYAERGPSALGNEYEPSSTTSEDDDEEDSEDELAAAPPVRAPRERERERPRDEGRRRRRR